jgi:hypothetical protein
LPNCIVINCIHVLTSNDEKYRNRKASLMAEIIAHRLKCPKSSPKNDSGMHNAHHRNLRASNGVSIRTSRQNDHGRSARHAVRHELHRLRGGCSVSTNHARAFNSGRITSRHSTRSPHSLQVPSLGQHAPSTSAPGACHVATCPVRS